jgi:hypothetical protein
MYAAFERESDSESDAVLSALDQIESSGTALTVSHVESEDLMSLADIARRVGRSRESVRQLAAATRRPGNFPAPATTLGAYRSLWRWSDVAKWFSAEVDPSVNWNEHDAVAPAINAVLELRRLDRDLSSTIRETLFESLTPYVPKSLTPSSSPPAPRRVAH